MKLSTQLLSLCALLITTASFAAPTADLLIVNHSVSALTVNSTYFQAFVLPTEIMPKSTIRIPETATFPLGNVREYIRLEDTADNSTHADEVYFS
ncbi:MAG: hypothetical protein EBX40_06405, partial [Gammaproteobacteria bacterium]|nr:hypothetical protein [Gammaproteobacteria bacterium]